MDYIHKIAMTFGLNGMTGGNKNSYVNRRNKAPNYLFKSPHSIYFLTMESQPVE